MARSFVFGFGNAPAGADFSARTLTVYNVSDVPATTVHTNAYGGTVTVSNEVSIGPGRHKAVLIDTRDNGDSRRQVLVFNGNAEFPSHAADDSELRIVSIEEMSSSSTLSSSSSS